MLYEHHTYKELGFEEIFFLQTWKIIFCIPVRLDTVNLNSRCDDLFLLKLFFQDK